MALSKEKKKYLDKMLSGKLPIDEMGSQLLSGYNEVLDEIVSLIDNELIVKRSGEIQEIGVDLEGFLEQIRQQSRNPKKGFFKSLFSSESKNKLLSIDGGIQNKTNKLMKAYKSSYEQLDKIVTMQVKKGNDVAKYIEEFHGISEYLKEKAVEMPQEGFNEAILYSRVCSFINNMDKMCIQLQQKQGVLKGSIINAIGLSGEMAAGMTHFESMMKDILISASADNIVKAGANIMNVFRSIIEKYGEYSVQDTIRTAEDVSEIRTHGAISLQSLQNTSSLLKTADSTYKALSTKQMGNNKSSIKALKNLQKEVQLVGNAHHEYLMSNDTVALSYKNNQDGNSDGDA